MTSLRMRVVEAGARAEWPWEADAVIAANWRKAGVRRIKEEIVANALDAMLDCLAENRETELDGFSVDELLAQLRESP